LNIQGMIRTEPATERSRIPRCASARVARPCTSAFRTTLPLLLLATVIACGDRSRRRTTDGGESADSTQPVTPMPPPPPLPRRPPGDTVALTATLKEYSIDVSPDTIVGGDISFGIRNDGKRPHRIEIRGDNGMRWTSLPVRPGGGVTLSISIEAGRYVVRSMDSAYVDRGMLTEFHVR